MTTLDNRLARYLGWLESDFADSYPSGVEGDGAWHVAVRFCYTLDCAALLLSDQQLDRLMRLLEYLDVKDGDFFSTETTSRLLDLPECEFARVVSREIAIAVADVNATMEDMAAGWRRGFRFPASPVG